MVGALYTKDAKIVQKFFVGSSKERAFASKGIKINFLEHERRL
jgi:hypothetical protein